MRVLRSLLYGYAGAVLAGLLVAVAGVGFELSHETVISGATIFGIIFGSAGLSLEHVFKATVWLTDVANFAAFNAVYGAAFGDAPPVRSTVCSGLMLPGALVEIEVTAHV